MTRIWRICDCLEITTLQTHGFKFLCNGWHCGTPMKEISKHFWQLVSFRIGIYQNLEVFLPKNELHLIILVVGLIIFPHFQFCRITS